MDWKNTFEIIKKIIAVALAKEGKKPTISNAAELFGVKPHIYQAWSKGQRPSFDELEHMARVLNLSPHWLLFGAGTPQEDSRSATFIPEYIEIGDTLKEVIECLPDSFLEIAKTGGISEDDLLKCINSLSLPSCLTIARWIHTYHINANFLIAQIGRPFLTDSEYKEKGDLDNIRERRGDFIDGKSTITEDELNEKLTAAQREMLTYKRLQTELGTPNEKIAAGIDVIIQARGRVTSDKSCYCTAEPEADPGYNQVHEPGIGFGRREKG